MATKLTDAAILYVFGFGIGFGAYEQVRGALFLLPVRETEQGADLNGDGVKDQGEDTNGDGVWDAQDWRHYILVALIESPRGEKILRDLVPVVEEVLRPRREHAASEARPIG